MQKHAILFLRGIADDRKIDITYIDKSGHYFFQYSGSANLSGYLPDDVFEKLVMTLDTNSTQELVLPKVDALFNQIADPDTHEITLAKVESLYKLFPEKTPLINRPADVRKTRRETVATLLQGIERLHVPKTVRIQPKTPAEIHAVIKQEGFTYPVIFRKAGDHGGVSTLLIENPQEQFHAFALDGRDYYLTQFFHTEGRKKIYSKYRLAVVDGEIYLRHVIFSDHWMIHSDSRTFMESDPRFQQEEKDILKTFDAVIKPKIEAATKTIHERIGLDYFGVDCHIDDDYNITLFELNANMNMLVNNAVVHREVYDMQIKKITDALTSMILERTAG